MPPDLSDIRAVSFDCYGTLIDWQRGLSEALEPLRPGLPSLPRGEVLFGEFARLERLAEQPPYCSYKDVLRQVFSGLSGVAGPCEMIDTLWRSLADWPAFDDVPDSLQRLRSRFGRLAVVSNIDDDLFEASHARLGLRLDALVTAQQVRSYKPGAAHFETLLARLKLEPAQVLHVAESRFHDVEPAKRLGFRTAWIRRQSGASASGSPTDDRMQADMEAISLRALCDAIGC
ncbi:MAG: HAD-IA family hydrolase [Phycisphaerales bacterium]|nr:HAD-IA family hydrolase [Planctomycetota bacterium]